MSKAIIRAAVLPILMTFIPVAVLLPTLFIGQTDIPKNIVDPAEGASPIERLADTALFKIGHYRRSVVEPDPEFPDDPSAGRAFLQGVEGDLITRCASTSLVAGIVATEAYVRPTWRRELELTLGRSWSAISGRLPDWSYGISQVKLTTAEAALEEAVKVAKPLLGTPGLPSREFLLSSLAQSENCEAFAAAALVLDPSFNSEQPVSHFAEKYRGGVSKADLPGVVSYEALVETISTNLPQLDDPNYFLWAPQGLVPAIDPTAPQANRLIQNEPPVFSDPVDEGEIGLPSETLLNQEIDSMEPSLQLQEGEQPPLDLDFSAENEPNVFSDEGLPPEDMEGDLPDFGDQFMPLLCLNRSTNGPFEINAFFVTEGDPMIFYEGEPYVEEHYIVETLGQIDPKGTSLRILHAQLEADPFSFPIRSYRELPFGAALDHMALVLALKDISLDLNDKWASVELISDQGNFETLNEKSWYCTVEVQIRSLQ